MFVTNIIHPSAACLVHSLLSLGLAVLHTASRSGVIMRGWRGGKPNTVGKFTVVEGGEIQVWLNPGTLTHAQLFFHQPLNSVPF